MTATSPPAFGIEALNAYAGLASVPVEAVFAGRGLQPERLGNLMMRSRSVGLPFEDPVTNAVNAARPLVDALGDDRESIELLAVATESGVDLSKSVASYVQDYLGLGQRCRVLELKQACYAATGAVQLAAGWLASGVSPGARALVVATDVALVDDRAAYAEPATGHGAVAILVSHSPRVLAIDPGAFGLHSYETMDSARPTPLFDVADVDRSLFAYLDCLSSSFRDYQRRVEGADFATTFDLLALHTPFAGLVKAAHRKMMREFAGAGEREADADFDRRVAPSLAYPALVGNLCSGSVYLALASAVEHAPLGAGARVGLYSYGSGCASEFYSGVAGPSASAAVGGMGIGAHLAARRELGFEEYARAVADSARCLVPEPDRRVDLAPYENLLEERADGPLLVHTGVKQYHRLYEWRGGRTPARQPEHGAPR